MAAQTLVSNPSDRRAALAHRSPLDDPRCTLAERQVINIADRSGIPYLLYRDCDGHQRMVVLEPTRGAYTLGRTDDADVALRWDAAVSRLHATLVCGAHGWSIVDDGQSSNGTFVNRERVDGRRQLRDRDLIQAGEVAIAFRDPAAL